MENVWPDKIQYAISVPNKGVIFGTPVTVDFTLVPLLKGLKIGKISTELIEMQEITPYLNGGTRFGQYKGTRVVAEDEWQIPVDTEVEDIGGQEGWIFQRAIAIPKSLGQCIQTVDAFGLRVRHRLRFNIQLHNPDDHTSEVWPPESNTDMEDVLIVVQASRDVTGSYLHISQSPTRRQQQHDRSENSKLSRT